MRSERAYLLTIVAVTLATAATVSPGSNSAAPDPRGIGSAVVGQTRSSPSHREVPDDAPAPRALLRQQKRLPARDWSRGPFTSIQVNVDLGGNNIVGDAANEPSYAIDPTDPTKMAIGWRQFHSVESNHREAGVAYSQDGGQTWTFPGVLEPGQFRSDPVLAADPAGNFYYSSLSSGTSAEMFKSTDGGVTWTFPPVTAFGGDKQWIAIDRTAGPGAGHIYQDWNVQFSCCPPNDFTRSIDGAASFQTPIAIPQPSLKWGTLDVGPGGELYLAGATLDQSSHVIARSSNAQNPAVTPTFDFVNYVDLGGVTAGWGGPNPGGLSGQVWVATDHSGGPFHGNVYMLASVWPWSDEVLDVMFMRSTNSGLNWSTPVRVNDDPNWNGAYQWFGTMSVAPNGRIDAVWNDTRNTGVDNLSELFYAYSEDEGVTWSANVPVSPVFDSWVGWPQQNKLGDYYHMISDNDGANLAYAATFNGEQDVYFVRIGHDCTGNGVADDCDVDCGPPGGRCDVPGCGTKADCNNNNLPDECEAYQDCNTNTFQDLCDIAAGTSQDCNWNDVPDECELVGNDCNGNNTPDECDLASGLSEDCNDNGILDECDISSEYSDDCQPDGVPDDCQLNDPVILPDLGPCSETADLGNPWCDDFETYSPGSIQGLNNWQGWGTGSGDPGAAGTVTTERNHTSGGSKSLRIDAYQDTVHLFNGYNLATSPLWVLRAWVYIPSEMLDTAMFIVLADYSGAQAGTSWVAQLEMTPWYIQSYETGEFLYTEGDSWSEIRLEIDFEQDWVEIFYNDTFLTEHVWSIGGGSMNLAAIDLYSPDSGVFYFDDLSVIKPLTTDCNGNEIPDECDIASGHSDDNDVNGVPDACEGGPRACCRPDGSCILALAEDCPSLGGVPLDSGAVCLGDSNGDGSDDACLSPCGRPPVYDPRVPDVGFGTRNRYLLFLTDDPGEETAVRVTFADLPPQYDTYEGDSWWVGEPFQVTEASNSAGPAPPPTFWAATLQCGTPFYADWSTYGTPIHVYDAGIIPDADYELQAINSFCNVDDERDYSDPLVIRTSASGDIVGASCSECPCSSPQGVVDFVDISAVVGKFKNSPCVEGGGPGVPRKSRADVISTDVSVPPPDRIIDFVDIMTVVGAFRGSPPALPGPQQHCTTP